MSLTTRHRCHECRKHDADTERERWHDSRARYVSGVIRGSVAISRSSICVHCCSSVNCQCSSSSGVGHRHTDELVVVVGGWLHLAWSYKRVGTGRLGTAVPPGRQRARVGGIRLQGTVHVNDRRKHTRQHHESDVPARLISWIIIKKNKSRKWVKIEPLLQGFHKLASPRFERIVLP